ncbi:50S ribosomal protein L11 methyltransferase [Segetibacter sp. 3557_3]|uniref:50S ribosomal protein L11 methyltransferase n=1 Tax=Segetibacter sp. 3557_3 TaxID=2547429 RepID=UPI00105902D6|nr:50S ribosomal protein L11 methyltransferase [Segetibacter sp. 3557_3]TDH21602.1 50S ribosomal protein L11 methyltransferase [Segetibacter sp. 3557_3]
MNFIQITVPGVSAEVNDILVARLSDLGFDGFEERDGELICSVGEANYDYEATSALLTQYQVEYSSATIEDQNWNAVWESNFEPVLVEDFCGIRAHFHDPFPNVDFDIVITPKMSFGTGHHATTFMMIAQMRQLNFIDKQVADFGTGTGILAILAEKMGAGPIYAIDEDDWSIENARENFARNDCNKISLVKSDAFRTEETFDIILANINRNVILDNLTPLTRALKKDGSLLLSGLLQQDEADIKQACEQRDLVVEKVLYRNNWISLLLKVK